MIFDLSVALTALIAGAVAAISGFGIGSLLTPLLSIVYGTKTAVALVAIPHAIATALRFWLIRKNLDAKIFVRFGIASAVGGLIGATINLYFTAKWLGLVLGGLLLLAGFLNLLQTLPKIKGSALLGGILSGMFGGMVGNQGGIRAVALLNFNLSKEAFIAVSTASALLVDGARLPVYLWFQSSDIFAQKPMLILMSVFVVLGTFAGMKILKKIDAVIFKRLLSILLITLGIFMLIRSI